MVAGPAPLHFVTGRARHTLIIEHIGDILLTVALQRPLKNLPDYFGGLWIDDDVVLVDWVLLVAVNGETTDVLALSALQIEDHADVLGKVLQVPLIDQAIDLAGLFVALNLSVSVVGHCDETDAPNGKEAVDVLLHQFHITGKPGLALTENDLEFLLLCCRQHPVEVWTETVGAGIILVAIDGVNVPAMIDGIVGQQGLLVLDALGFRLVFVFVLLTQAYIDCAKYLLHLLEGVTAHL